LYAQNTPQLSIQAADTSFTEPFSSTLLLFGGIRGTVVVILPIELTAGIIPGYVCFGLGLCQGYVEPEGCAFVEPAFKSNLAGQ
jgi:hypothetical protein